MFDLKVLHSALSQLEEERGIPREKIIEAIEDALAAAYKKDYGKKGQIIRARFNIDTGITDYYRVKTVVDDDNIIPEDEIEEGGASDVNKEVSEDSSEEDVDERVKFNEEHHILLSDAKKIKKDAQAGSELTFPLETMDDFGRIAAQTAKQVIIQRVREAEKVSVLAEYEDRKKEIVTGSVQRVERGNVFIDLGRTTAILPKEEQVPGEYYRQGERIKAYLYSVDETPRGIDLRLSRSHPDFLAKLFEVESPEIANGAVTIEGVAREAGSRSKIAVKSHDDNIDAVGSLVGQRGIRVNTIISELGGEKIDIIEWSDDPAEFISHALSPARILSVEIHEDTEDAKVKVDQDQFSLAIGKGGQNVRLAAKLTGWKLDIESTGGETSSDKKDEPADDSSEEVSSEESAEESNEVTPEEKLESKKSEEEGVDIKKEDKDEQK